MRTFIKFSLVIAALGLSTGIQAQNRDLDNYRQPDKRGVNVFESPKDTASTFDGVKVRVGGASTLQYQAIDHENATGAAALLPITNNFNLATANLDLDVALAKGLRMHLRTYLSSRHHPEPYVKGGYLQIDNLDFIKEGLASDLMKNVTIMFGHMEINYGDAHFRRSDNAQALYNPFVGNYLMDSFTTEVGAEAYYRKNGFLAMLGVTNTKLNQDVKDDVVNGNPSPSFVAKLGYDKQINSDLRFRLTGSLYNTAYANRTYLYAGDRAGARYYLVMAPPLTNGAATTATNNYTTGRYNPNFNRKLTAIMINPFVKYQGLEFFGLLEFTNGRNANEVDRRNATQLGAELLYRFGSDEKFYVGGRYNSVSAEDVSGVDIDITRFNIGGGWFMTKNIVAKVEYVTQKYDGFATGNVLDGGKFSGFVAEAVISF
ncbi:hypothetical protein [Flavobacterium cheniae]|uniref:Phosphate-selective porin O/P n=1 Tax=Flavobacterium cheniae TaxID=295428 RepID=A0A562KLW5_9FLAO|nr:hypothetical protein [Flavobacterium cheniae]TDR24280.1 hypothetical protein C8D80_1316 [Flavobacterium cheniae]TWH96400.1 hypothetical protein IP97_00941 [Flavobacterium cheniae]